MGSLPSPLPDFSVQAKEDAQYFLSTVSATARVLINGQYVDARVRALQVEIDDNLMYMRSNLRAVENNKDGSYFWQQAVDSYALRYYYDKELRMLLSALQSSGTVNPTISESEVMQIINQPVTSADTGLVDLSGSGTGAGIITISNDLPQDPSYDFPRDDPESTDTGSQNIPPQYDPLYTVNPEPELVPYPGGIQLDTDMEDASQASSLATVFSGSAVGVIVILIIILVVMRGKKQ